MRTRFQLNALALLLFVLSLSLLSCENSQQPNNPAPAAQSKPATEKVYVEFRGPWAFVQDPKDPNLVIAIAPKAKGHRDLYVQASNHSLVPAGIFELSLPAHSGSAAATPDPAIAQAKLDPQNLQHALDNKSARYVIRLPKPEAYVPALRARSRLGASYPPDASTEKDYATAVALLYNVSTFNGFSLAGTPDTGSFNPLLLQVETQHLRFVIAPAEENDPKDQCDTHSRASFHDLTSLLGLTLFVDFPNNPDSCHKNDPQNSRAHAGVPSPDIMPTGSDTSRDLQSANFAASGLSLLQAARNIEHRIFALSFFDHPSGDCASPNLILSTNP
jgi:hypothetical protein